MMKKRLFFGSSVLALVILLAACGPTANPPATVTTAPAVPTEAQDTAQATPYPQAPAAGNPYPLPTTNVYPDSNSTALPYPAQPGVIAVTPYPDPASDQDPVASGDEPWRPQAGDAGLEQGNAFVEEAQVLTMESMPPQFTLQVSGNKPTPCHLVRMEIGPPNPQNQIEVKVYTVVKGDLMCTQVLAPFALSAPLTGLPAGKYTVVVNGKAAGSFDVP